MRDHTDSKEMWEEAEFSPGRSLNPVALSLLKLRSNVTNPWLLPQCRSQVNYSAVDMLPIGSRFLGYLVGNTAATSDTEIIIEQNTNEVIELAGIEATKHA